MTQVTHMGTKIYISRKRIRYKLFRINPNVFERNWPEHLVQINHSKSVNAKQSDRSAGPHKISYTVVTGDFPPSMNCRRAYRSAWPRLIQSCKSCTSNSVVLTYRNIYFNIILRSSIRYIKWLYSPKIRSSYSLPQLFLLRLWLIKRRLTTR